LFRVVECDSCECPMIVYVAAHKQNLDTEEIIEAFNLCEDVGNDFYGQGRWFIEGKQRKIHDHFHWHVRELKMVNDILAVKLLGLEPQLGEPSIGVVDNFDEVKTRSFLQATDHVKGQPFTVLEKRIQRGQADLPQSGSKLVVWSKVRMTFESIWAIEQQVIVLPQGGLEALSKMTIAS